MSAPRMPPTLSRPETLPDAVQSFTQILMPLGAEESEYPPPTLPPACSPLATTLPVKRLPETLHRPSALSRVPRMPPT